MNKSGTASQVIAHPKGGGAIKGVGESFSPDLHTGTGNLSVPIGVPSGRAGVQPGLTLAYSTGQGNGPFGLGWSLSVPGVARDTSKQIPTYDDEHDIFLLSGAEQLVPVGSPSQGAVRYRPRTEGLFARITHFKAITDDYWEVRSRDGMTSLYGHVNEAGQDAATVCNPNDNRRVFAWHLTQTVDPYGNRIEYLYEREPGREEGPHHWDQTYLKSIRYGDYGPTGNPQFMATVDFFYEARPDPFSSYKAGFEIRTTRRCARIEISTHAEVARLSRVYRLIYLDQVDPDAAPANGASLLHSIEVEGVDGNAREKLPPLEFGYTSFDPGRRDYQTMTGISEALPERSLSHPDFELADLFGRGLPDVVQIGDTARYWRNMGGGRFNVPLPIERLPVGFRLGDPGVQLADVDGDGHIDMLVSAGLVNGYVPLTVSGKEATGRFVQYEAAPPFPLDDPEVRLLDLNGDGITDAVRTGARFELYFHDRQLGWNRVESRTRRDFDQFPDVQFSDPRVKLADMTGDGLQDIVFVSTGRVDYWPYMGHGRWGKRVAMKGRIRFPDGQAFGAIGFDPKRLLLGDVDGDGVSDLLYVESGRITIWLNQSGNRWSNPIVINGTPAISDVDSVRLVDMLGNGTEGILWTNDLRTLGESTYKFLDLTGGLKPYLLNERNNHTGARTLVEYAPSTRFYVEDEARPQTRWQTRLPFPVQVVSRVEVIDEISGGKLTMEYRYHQGYWDGDEREFRGFGMVEQFDTETFDRFNAEGLHGTQAFNYIEPVHFSPPTLMRTWFHQGLVQDSSGAWKEPDPSIGFWPGDHSMFGRDQRVELAALAGSAAAHGEPTQLRHALRALRGTVLRTETYGLDDSPHSDRPYTVTESLYDVREVESFEHGTEDRLRIFFPFQRASRTSEWERGSEPMTQFAFTADYDTYGQPRQQLSIAVPRGRNPLETLDAADEAYLSTFATTQYVQRDDAQIYMVDRVARGTIHEVLNDGKPGVFELRDAVLAGLGSLRVIDHSRSFYDGDAFVGLPLGQLGRFGAVVRTETLAFTDGFLDTLYDSKDPKASQRPVLLNPQGVTVWPAEYPDEFKTLLPALAGYLHYRDGDVPGSPGGYYIVAERHRYDFHDPSRVARGLPVASRDPLGAESQIEYDKFDLLPAQTTDAVGLTTRALYDYRVLQVSEITDVNANTASFTYSPAGFLSAQFARGKTGEGDGANPSLRMEYDLLAFSERRQPIFVRSIRRVHHDSETDVPADRRNETLVSVEYSDGFGRLLQKRDQAEDTLFGDPVFGGGVISANQSDAVGLVDLPPPSQEGPGEGSGGPAGGSDPAGPTVDQILMLGGENPIDDPGGPGGEADPIVPTVGRTRAPGDPDNVVVSGWQVYDNKGRVVEKYEPFFARGYEFSAPGDNELGRKATIFYDARGQMVRTVSPDGSEQRVVLGIPTDLANPDLFDPTPWETYNYDGNDNAGRTHGNTASVSTTHWNTPTNIVIDALGRAITAIARNGPEPTRWFVTRSSYDIQGNVVAITDALGRIAFEYTFDLAGRGWRMDCVDAGRHDDVLDVLGNAVETRDSKGALVLQSFDVLHRPIRLWARDDASGSVTLRVRYEYGDGGGVDQPPGERVAARSLNLLGQLTRHHDEAGLVTVVAMDFKGNIVDKSRRVIADGPILAVFAQAPTRRWQVKPFQVDWQPLAPIGGDGSGGPPVEDGDGSGGPAGGDGEGRPGGGGSEGLPTPTLADRESQLLETASYRTTASYDALNRIKRMQFPRDVLGQRRELRPEYNRAGGLNQVWLDNTLYVERIAYDAKGQRALIAYGNGVMTRYAYDSKTFRLTRIRSEHYAKSDEITYRPMGPTLQDLGYGYDLVGNIIAIGDRAPASGIPNNPDALSAGDPMLAHLLVSGNALNRRFDYDPIYRLVSATGRECDHPPDGLPWEDRPRCTDLTRARAYTEHYVYDAMGNMLRLEHRNGVGGFTREFTFEAGSNRLRAMKVGASTYDYGFDSTGNMRSETSSRHFEWNHVDQMKVYRTQTDGAEPSMHAHYLYDDAGQRVKKLVRKQGGQIEVTHYIDSLFEHHRWGGQSGASENNHVHLMDDKQRIALVRFGATHPNDQGPSVQFHLGDHLGSSNVIADAGGALINREEFTPGGETTFGSFAKKRYRFTGMERDEESGVAYHGARYYAPFSGRWISCDPSGFSGGPNLYSYAANSPLSFLDTTGHSPQRGPLTFPINEEYQGVIWRGRPLGPYQTLPPPGPRRRGSAASRGSRVKGVVGGKNGQGGGSPPSGPPDKGATPPAGSGAGGAGPAAEDLDTHRARGEPRGLGGSPGSTDASNGGGEGKGGKATVLGDLAALAALVEDPASLYDAKQSGNSGTGAQIGHKSGIISGWLAQALTVALVFGGAVVRAVKAIGGWFKKRFQTLLEGFERKAITAGERSIRYSKKQLQHGFKHAKDFGVSANQSNKALAEFSAAVQNHVDAPGTLVIQGTYHNIPATHFVDPTTGLNVIRDATGNFWSGWKLSPAQLHHVLTTGKL
jgi:RHS repeat-associated protein